MRRSQTSSDDLEELGSIQAANGLTRLIYGTTEHMWEKGSEKADNSATVEHV